MGLGLKKKFKKVKKSVKKIGKGVGKIATGHVGSGVSELGRGVGGIGKMVAPYVGMIPGIGPVVGGAIGAGSSALAGDNRNQILRTGVKGALSGYAGSKVGGLPGLMNTFGEKGLMGGLGAVGSQLTGLGGSQAGLNASAMMNPTGGFFSQLGDVGLNALGLGGLTTSSFGIPEGGFQLGNSIFGADGNLIHDLAGGSGFWGNLGQSVLGNVLGGGQQPGAGQQGGFNLGGLGGLLAAGGAGALLGSALDGGGGPTEGVQKDVLSAEDKAFYNRPSQKWDMAKLQQDASASGVGLNDYVSRNWDKLQSGQYNTPASAGAQPVALARGGALLAATRHVNGPGTGRSDSIGAELSDGEYVFDAESVAMLGDGSNKAGAQRLDEMREALRKHKGRTLARGDFSPNAKAPLNYIKEYLK